MAAKKKATVMRHGLSPLKDGQRTATVELSCGHSIPADRPMTLGQEVECEQNHSKTQDVEVTTFTPSPGMGTGPAPAAAAAATEGQGS